MLTERYKGSEITSICGLDARGFVLGPPLALALKKPFFMLRKKGKMPNAVTGAAYAKESPRPRRNLRNVHVAAAAAPRLVSTEYPTSRPRRRRDSPPRNTHVAAAAVPRLVSRERASNRRRARRELGETIVLRRWSTGAAPEG